MEKPFDQAQLLKTNPRVDVRLVRQFEQLERQLERLGVDLRPSYSLQPPLGGSVGSLLSAANAVRQNRNPS